MLIEYNTNKVQNRRPIWRYIDFTKYVDMLDTRALYFTNVKEVEDPLDSSFYRLFKKTVHQVKNTSNASRLKALCDISRDTTYINCWHINEVESVALWKLYLKSNEGIAIKSTVGRFRKVLRNCSWKIYLSKVVYNPKKVRGTKVHQKGTSYGEIDAASVKDPSFSHEKEIRAILFAQSGEKGISIEVDLDVLIQEIYIAPNSPEWIKVLVEKVSRKYGYAFKVIPSDLYKDPFGPSGDK